LILLPKCFGMGSPSRTRGNLAANHCLEWILGNTLPRRRKPLYQVLERERRWDHPPAQGGTLRGAHSTLTSTGTPSHAGRNRVPSWSW